MIKNQELLQTYEQLTLDEKRVVQILTLVNEFLRSHELHKLVSASNLGRHNKPISAANIATIQNKLKKSGLLTNAGNKYNKVSKASPAIFYHVISSFVKEEYFEPVWKKIKAIWSGEDFFHLVPTSRYLTRLYVAFYQNNAQAFLLAAAELEERIYQQYDDQEFGLNDFLIRNFIEQRIAVAQIGIKIYCYSYMINTNVTNGPLKDRLLKEAALELLLDDNADKHSLLFAFQQEQLWTGHTRKVLEILQLRPDAILIQETLGW